VAYRQPVDFIAAVKLRWSERGAAPPAYHRSARGIHRDNVGAENSGHARRRGGQGERIGRRLKICPAREQVIRLSCTLDRNKLLPDAKLTDSPLVPIRNAGLFRRLRLASWQLEDKHELSCGENSGKSGCQVGVKKTIAKLL